MSSTSSFLNQKKSGVLKSSDGHQSSPKPDSTKPSKTSLVDATYFDNSDDEDSSSSDYDSDSPKKVTKKRGKEDSDSNEVDMDIDDIDAALDMAFDSKEKKVQF